MLPVELTLAFPDRSDLQREVRSWAEALALVPAVAHVSIRTVNELGGLIVLFLRERQDIDATLSDALRLLRQEAPGCAISVRFATNHRGG